MEALSLTDKDVLPFHIIINENAGTVLSMGQDALTALINETLGNRVQDINYVQGKGMAKALAAVLENKKGHILVGGGDGTIASCASLLIKDKVPFGILPLGTMNLLARDLNIPVDIKAALESYKHCKLLEIDAGRINDYIFLCNVAVGLIPEASILREETRKTPSLGSWSNLVAAVFQGLDKSNRRRFRLRHHNRRHVVNGNVLVIANNAYADSAGLPSDRLHRNVLTDGQLAVYSAGPSSFVGTLRLLLKLAVGLNWQKDEAVHRFFAKNLQLESRKKTIMVAIDGEPMNVKAPARIEILPQALPLLVPDEAAVNG